MMFIFLFSRRVTARGKVSVICKSNVSKIPPNAAASQLKLELKMMISCLRHMASIEEALQMIV
jgi:hypothetical protein